MVVEQARLQQTVSLGQNIAQNNRVKYPKIAWKFRFIHRKVWAVGLAFLVMALLDSDDR